MNEYIIIVDNFFPYPLRIRSIGLTNTYDKKPQTNYSCLSSFTPNYLKDEYLYRTLKFIGDSYKSNFLESEFVMYTNLDQTINFNNNLWIHSDNCRWVGVLFLNDNINKYQGGGISFYKHKVSNVFRREEIKKNLQLQKRLNDDSANIKKWKELYYIDNIFNRLALFDSRIFHQAKNYFGNSKLTCRLTLNIYFK